MNPTRRFALLAIALSVATGCAGTPSTAKVEDPYEGLNRKVYAFNATVDRYSLKPAARVYRTVVPRFARSGVTNFFENLVTPRSSLNNFLQGKPQEGMSEMARFVFNSTVGLGGLIDVAGRSGIEANTEDFGQTFAAWGMPSGPYLYLPIFGPSTGLDLFARPFDWYSDPVNYIDDTGTEDKLRVLRIVQIRAQLLSAEGLIEDSEDPYVALREAYLQNREFRIFDGDPPTSEEEDDLFNEFFEEDL